MLFMIAAKCGDLFRKPRLLTRSGYDYQVTVLQQLFPLAPDVSVANESSPTIQHSTARGNSSYHT